MVGAVKVDKIVDSECEMALELVLGVHFFLLHQLPSLVSCQDSGPVSCYKLQRKEFQ